MPNLTAPRLFQLTQDLNAQQYGNFTLTGGQPSDYYFDGRLLTLHPHSLRLVCQEFLDRIRDPEITAVGGPTLGADPIIGGLLLVSRLRPGPELNGFIIRKQAKGHGTGNRIEGHLSPGQKVALVDDTCSHGGTLLDAVQAVEAAGAQVSQILVMLDRVEDGGSVELKRAGHPVTSLFTSFQLKAAIPRPGNTLEEALANRFNALAELCEVETGGYSDTGRMIAHPAYNEVFQLGLDYPLIPLLLQRIKTQPHPWYHLLQTFAHENPAKDATPGKIQEIVNCWLEWGRQNGHIE